MKINKKRPLERLVGNNRGIINMLVDNRHVGESLMEVCRAVIKPRITRLKGSRKLKKRKAGWRKIPPALRRGMILCCYERHTENFKLYAAVNP